MVSMSGEVPLGGGGEVPRGGIEGVFEGREDIDLGGREDVDLERSGVDLKRSDDRVEVDFEPSNDRVIIDLEPSNASFDRVIVDFEMSATPFVPSNMKVPAVEVFAKLGETEAGLVRAVVIVIEDEVLMDVIALKEEEVATEYKLPEVLAVERIDGEGSRPPFVSPTADSPSPEGILDCVSPKGFLGPGNAPKLGGGGSSSKGGRFFEANACL
jgi:hypothetical protein